MNMTMSGHAAKRQQQRAITDLEVELLMMYGREVHHGEGRVMTYLDKKGYKRLERDVRRIAQKLERLRDEFLIESDDVVVTVGHRYRHINTK